jgi:hypothetical protein
LSSGSSESRIGFNFAACHFAFAINCDCCNFCSRLTKHANAQVKILLRMFLVCYLIILFRTFRIFASDDYCLYWLFRSA